MPFSYETTPFLAAQENDIARSPFQSHFATRKLARHGEPYCWKSRQSAMMVHLNLAAQPGAGCDFGTS